MARKRKKKQSEPIPVERKEKPRRRIVGTVGRIFLTGIVVVGSLLAAAPYLICKTPMLGMVVRYGLPKWEGQIEFGAFDFGWITPAKAYDVVVFDQNGQEIGRVDSVVTSKSLIDLLLDRHQLGTIQINQPELIVAVGNGSSNWEDMLASVETTEPNDASATDLPVLLLEIVDGSVNLKNSNLTKPCSFRSINGTIDVGCSDSQLFTSNIALTVVDGEQVGKGSFQFSSQVPTNDKPFASSGAFQVDLSDASLRPFAAFAERWKIPWHLVGSTNCNLAIGWNQQKHRVDATGVVEVSNLEFSCPQILDDTIRIEELRFDSDVRCEGAILHAEKFSLVSSIGTLSLTGDAPLDDLPDHVSIPQLLSAFQNGQARVQGQIDLAALTRTLPNTLKIREDTKVTAGQISLDINASPSERGVEMAGYLHSSELTAINRGQTISWERPIQTDFKIVGTEDQLRIDNLTCRSTFFSMRARGDLQQGALTAKANLQRFQNQFEQLFDFRDSDWNGIVDVKCRWKRLADESIAADGEFLGKHLKIALPYSRTVDEQRIDGRFRCKMELEGLSINQIQVAECAGNLSNDRFSISMLESSSGLDAEVLPLKVSVNGELSSWNARLDRLGVEIPARQLNGLIDLSASLQLSDQAIQFDPIRATFTRLRVRNESFFIDEPTAKLSMAGSYKYRGHQLNIPQATFSSTSVSAVAKDVRVDATENPVLEGDVRFRGDLGRMQRSLMADERARRIAGTIEGSAHLKSSSVGVQFDGNSLTKNLQFLRQSPSGDRTQNQHSTATPVVWDEPAVRLAAKGVYDSNAHHVDVSKLSLQTESIGLAASGTVRSIENNAIVDLQGTAAYDLDLLAKRFQSQLGDQIEISGKAEKPFQLRGPLFSSQETIKLVRSESRPQIADNTSAIFSDALRASVGLGWDKAKIYGLEIDSGEISAQLIKQRLRFDPFKVQVGSGMLAASPILDFRGTSPELIVRKGRVLENIELSPELCENWLKFVAPLLANATRAAGKFSVDLKSARLPFDRPGEVRMGGGLAIHQGQVGPGSLSKRLLTLAQQLKTLLRQSSSARIVDPERAWLTLPEQQVDFVVRNGQVGHHGLKMNLGDVPVETNGWVTIDERLRMEATFPIQKDWLGNDRFLTRLEGQTLTIPITGTISRPQLDRRGLQRFTRQAATKAAEGILKEEIGNQLQRLFRQK